MIITRDRRVSRWFWKAETEHYRLSIRVHFWLYPSLRNVLRLNRQPRVTELIVARSVVLCHSRLGAR